MKKIIKLVVVASIIISLIVYGKSIFGLSGANDSIKTKVQLVKESLKKSGYTPKWVVISEKRSEKFNSLLSNSAKKSHHLCGNAIDVFIIDIDGDGNFNQKDLDIVAIHNKKVEKNNPKLKGGFGTYTSKDIAKRMIHFDTRGYSVVYNY